MNIERYNKLKEVMTALEGVDLDIDVTDYADFKVTLTLEKKNE